MAVADVYLLCCINFVPICGWFWAMATGWTYLWPDSSWLCTTCNRCIAAKKGIWSSYFKKEHFSCERRFYQRLFQKLVWLNFCSFWLSYYNEHPLYPWHKTKKDKNNYIVNCNVILNIGISAESHNCTSLRVIIYLLVSVCFTVVDSCWEFIRCLFSWKMSE